MAKAGIGLILYTLGAGIGADMSQPIMVHVVAYYGEPGFRGDLAQTVK